VVRLRLRETFKRGNASSVAEIPFIERTRTDHPVKSRSSDTVIESRWNANRVELPESVVSARRAARSCRMSHRTLSGTS
jgi:hypothetical protein